MACYFPVNAWKSQRLNESGKRGITFSLREGFQDQPLQVPCGKCDGCRASRAQMWAVRMHNEAALHERNSFLTLTYADPAPPVLDKKHLQDFFKRARHHYKFRYFGVGEYGDQTSRPHYHAIIFGEDFLAGSFKINDELYVDPKLEELWGHGHIAIAPANMSSMCYVAGYVFKKVGAEETFPPLMSRRPGIGHEWLDQFSDDIRRIGGVVVEGKVLPVPIRYLVWNEADLEDVKRARKRMFTEMTADERFVRQQSLPARQLAKAAQLKLRSKKL